MGLSSSLLIGVNDQYRGRDVDEYVGRFTALLQRAIALADGRAERVLVLSIPDWGVTPFARDSGRDLQRIADELDAYNAAAHDICDGAWRGVRRHHAGVPRTRCGSRSMLADDGLHPSAAMYAQWTQLALPVVREELGLG